MSRKILRSNVIKKLKEKNLKKPVQIKIPIDKFNEAGYHLKRLGYTWQFVLECFLDQFIEEMAAKEMEKRMKRRKVKVKK